MTVNKRPGDKLAGGLVSVTFRQLAPEAIVELTRQAGLACIEWGGDIHVPHGDLARAEAVARLTGDAGLRVAAYGSYYRVGAPPHETPPWLAVQETALALGAPVVRVWAGNLGSRQADGDIWDRVVADAQRIAELARDAGLIIAFEHHHGTLADGVATARDLYRRIGCPNVRLCWQPLQGLTTQQRVTDLRALLPQLAHLHVFHWPEIAGAVSWRPLAEGDRPWRRYLRVLNNAPVGTALLLEFVKDHDPEQFLRDAATLRGWLDGSSKL